LQSAEKWCEGGQNFEWKIQLKVAPVSAPPTVAIPGVGAALAAPSAAPALGLIALAAPSAMVGLRSSFPGSVEASLAAADPAASAATLDYSDDNVSATEERARLARFQSETASLALKATLTTCEETIARLKRRLGTSRIMAEWAEIATFVAGGSILSTTVANFGPPWGTIAKVVSGSIAITGGVLGIISRKGRQFGGANGGELSDSYIALVANKTDAQRLLGELDIIKSGGKMDISKVIEEAYALSKRMIELIARADL
jgi:hypothetical protein